MDFKSTQLERKPKPKLKRMWQQFQSKQISLNCLQNAYGLPIHVHKNYETLLLWWPHNIMIIIAFVKDFCFLLLLRFKTWAILSTFLAVIFRPHSILYMKKNAAYFFICSAIEWKKMYLFISFRMNLELSSKPFYSCGKNITAGINGLVKCKQTQ